VFVRQATSADVLAIVALVESAYRGQASRAGWTTEADLLDGQRTDAAAVRQIIDHPAARILVACEDIADPASDVPLASVAVTDEGASADAVHVSLFAVRPVLQGRGIGRALLGEAEQVGRRLGRRVARMTVLAQRPELIAWYERRGYHRTGERAPFPYDDARLGTPRRPDLVFEILEKSLAGDQVR
jgi:ribosomal protein S18 acetylase RimI-like enzyme